MSWLDYSHRYGLPVVLGRYRHDRCFQDAESERKHRKDFDLHLQIILRTRQNPSLNSIGTHGKHENASLLYCLVLR